MVLSTSHTQIVESVDGTLIAVTITGIGRPLVIEPGSLSMAAHWQQVADLLSEDATVYVIDRRGRGDSGPHSDHSLTHEYDDLAAVRAVAGKDAAVLGHSYGAVIALGQAMIDPPSGLVVYEPPLPLDGPIGESGLAPFDAALDDGDLDGALAIGMKHFVRMPDPVVDSMRQAPIWDLLRPVVPTWGPEIRALDSFGSDLERFAALEAPVLELVGELSPPWLVDISERLAGALPDARIERLAGQAHEAYVGDPGAIARAVREFLRTV